MHKYSRKHWAVLAKINDFKGFTNPQLLTYIKETVVSREKDVVYPTVK